MGLGGRGRARPAGRGRALVGAQSAATTPAHARRGEDAGDAASRSAAADPRRRGSALG